MNVAPSTSAISSVFEQIRSRNGSQAAAPAPLPAPLFNNPNVPIDAFLAKAKQFFDEFYMLCAPWFKAPMPHLEQAQLIALITLLSATRVIKGRNNTFEVSFTLHELFNFLLSKGDKNITQCIEDVELVGSAVFWMLKDYMPLILSEMGVNPEEWLTEKIKQRLERTPADVDFRLYAPKASYQDIIALRDAIIEFIVEKKAETQPDLDKAAFKKIVFDNGFTLFTQPVEGDDLMSTIGLMDHKSKRAFDVVIYRKLKFMNLCIKDSVRIRLNKLITALTTNSAEDLITMIKSKAYNPYIFPCSNVGTGRQAFFDKAAGIIRVLDPHNIKCSGWAIYQVWILKGDRSFPSDLELILLNNLRRSLEGYSNPIDMPEALHKKLLCMEQTLPKRMAAAAAYWLEKAIQAHIGNNPKAATILVLQACISLQEHGYGDAVDDLWLHMKEVIGEPKKGVCLLLHKVMNSGQNVIPALISLLEAKAFLFMHARDQTLTNFSADLVMHKQKAAIQIHIEGIPCLLPFDPVRAITHCKAGNFPGGLKILEDVLQPTQLFKPNPAMPEITLIEADDLNDLSSPWQRMVVEWILAVEAQHRTAYGAACLEKVMPDFLAHTPAKERKRILQSLENKENSVDEVKIYTAMSDLCANDEQDTVPVQLKWALALTAVQDPARCRTAYVLWQTHKKGSIKKATTMEFIKQLSPVRPDLAVEILPESPSGEFSSSLGEIQNGYIKNPQISNEKGVKALAICAKKIYQIHQIDTKTALWIMEELIKLGAYKEAFNLSELGGFVPAFFEKLTQNASLHKNNLFNSILSSVQDKRSDELVQHLLNMRKHIATVLEAPLALSSAWKKEDEALADLLSSAKSIDMQIQAFQLYVELGLDDKAQHALLPLLQHKDIKGKEAVLLPIILRFISSLPKEKAPAVLQILTAPGVEAVFKQDFASALNTLLNWHATLPAESAPSKLTLQLYQHALTLCTLPVDAPRLVSKLTELIQYASAQDKLPRYSDLRNFLINQHSLIIKVLEKEGKGIELYTLLNAMKHHAFKIDFTSEALEICYKLFQSCVSMNQSGILQINELFLWLTDDYSSGYRTENAYRACIFMIHMLLLYNFEKEAAFLAKSVITNIKPENCKTIFAEAAALYPATCRVLLEQAVASDNKDVMILGSQIFWENFIVTQALFKYPNLHARAWRVFLDQMCKMHPDAFLMVFKDIKSLKAAMEKLEQKEQSKITLLVLTGAASSGKAVKADARKAFLQQWTEAKTQLEPYVASHADKIQQAEILIHILSGDLSDYKWAYSRLLLLLVNVSEEYEKYISVVEWLYYLFTLTSKETVAQITREGAFHLFMNKLCKLSECQKVISNNIMNLFAKIFLQILEVDEALTIFDKIMTLPLTPMMVGSGLWVVVNMLKRRQLSKVQRVECLRQLTRFFEVVFNDAVLFSLDFALLLNKPPFLEQKMIGDADIASYIFYGLLKIHFDSIGKINFDEKNSAHWIEIRQKLLELCQFYMPFLSETHRDECCKIAFTSIIEVFVIDEQTSTVFYRKFMNSAIAALQTKYGAKAAEKHLNQMRLAWIKEFLKYECNAINMYLTRSNFIKFEFNAVINSKIVDVDEFQTTLQDYVFNLPLKMKDDFFDALPIQLLDMHNNNITHVICEANSRKLIPNTEDLFKYHIMLNLHIAKSFHNLTSEQKEQALKNMLEQLLACSTYYSMCVVVTALENPPHLGFPISAPTLSHYWKELIKKSARIPYMPKSGYRVLARVVNALTGAKLWTNPNKLPEYQEACAQICQAVFEELCNPMTIYEKSQQTPPSPTEMCRRTGQFLEKACKAGLFAGKIDVYYKLVGELIVQFKLEHKVIYELIVLNSVYSMPEGPLFAAKVLTTWLEALASVDPKLAESLLIKAKLNKILEDKD